MSTRLIFVFCGRKRDRNPVVNFYSLKTASRGTRNVSDCYGNLAMYKDLSAADDTEHIETALSVLEGKAARIIKRVLDTQSSGGIAVKMTRSERNDLRKFVFVMMYRGQKFWRKWSKSIEEYDSADKGELIPWMAERGFEKPIQVWLHNLRLILDCEIDLERNWARRMMDEMFPPDATWFVSNMQMFYAAFCQPQDLETDEFILSENAFGIHEGPTRMYYPLLGAAGILGAQTGEFHEWHKFVPLAPNLMLVLRSNLLRKTVEAERERRMMANLPGGDLLNTPSILEGFDIPHATPGYQRPGAVRYEYKDDDVFLFPMVKLPPRCVHLINMVILQEAKASLTWKTDEILAKQIVSYIEEPLFNYDEQSYAVAPEYQDAQVRRNKLLMLARELEGSISDLI